MKKVSMKKISEVLRFHFKLELSIRQSANAANVSRSTASDYCKRFKELDISIDSFISLDEIQQEDLFFPKKVQIYKNQSSTSKVIPDCNYIHNELKKKKVTLSLLHEEYKELNPDNYYSYCKNRSYSDTKTENIRTPYRSTFGQ